MYSYYFCAHSTKTATENDVVLYSTYMENECSDIIWIYMSHNNKQIEVYFKLCKSGQFLKHFKFHVLNT